MHVISYKRIREFFSMHRDSRFPLAAWFKIVNKATWQNFAELRMAYPSADLVGRYTVFNFAGNKYRLISRIVYRSQTVFIVAILTHKEYDSGKWKE
jgi:mRNA interferase HigB